jgi:hypothetical protein
VVLEDQLVQVDQVVQEWDKEEDKVVDKGVDDMKV